MGLKPSNNARTQTLEADSELEILGTLQFGATDSAALTVGGGTATTPLTTATANTNFIGFWLDSTATSGDSRGLYLRQYFSGAGVSGEAARLFGTVNNVAAAVGGTVNGAHVSLSVTGASGAVSGAGNALRATLGLGASTNAGGTLAAIQVDSDFDNAATVPATAAAIRVTNSNTKLWANLLSIPNAANGTIFAAHTTQVLTHSIKFISADGTAYYLMCTNAATNRS
jgi:hypothetical protein